MGRILKDIYTDVSIAPLLGFKGGTCAYLFYGLPRFSVDLDFDLLEVNEENCLGMLKNYPSLPKDGFETNVRRGIDTGRQFFRVIVSIFCENPAG